MNGDGIIDRKEASLSIGQRPRRLVSRGRNVINVDQCTSPLDGPSTLDGWAKEQTGVQRAGFFTVDLKTTLCQLLCTDPYHTIVNMPTMVLVLVFILVYMLLFFVFGFIFWLVESVEPGSFETTTGEDGTFWTCFECSWQSLLTVGYGTTYPTHPAAQIIASFAVVVSLLVDSFAVGIFFSNLSQASRKEESILCSKVAVVHGPPGKRYFECRVHHLASHPMVDPSVKLYLCRWGRYPEPQSIDPRAAASDELLSAQLLDGTDDFAQSAHAVAEQPWQQGIDLDFEELEVHSKSDRCFLQLPWCVRHHISQDSPLHQISDQELQDIEIFCVVLGTAASTGNTCEFRHSYVVEELRFEHRFVNVLSLDPNGTLDIDLTKFHETAPSPIVEASHCNTDNCSADDHDQAVSPFSSRKVS